MKKKNEIHSTTDYLQQFLDKMYHFIATFLEKKKLRSRIGKVLKYLYWVVTISVVVFFLINRRYLGTFFLIDADRTSIDYKLGLYALCAGFYLALPLSYYFSKTLYFLMVKSGEFEQRFFEEPLQRGWNKLVTTIRQNNLWLFLVSLGRKLGFKYLLFPALTYLEPNSDRRTINLDLLDQLPPQAYTDEKYSQDTINRYQALSGIDFYLSIMGCFFIPSPLLVAVSSLLSGLPFTISDVFISALISMIFLVFFLIVKNAVNPWLERYAKWRDCLNMIQRKHRLDAEIEKLDSKISNQLQLDIERLRTLYESEYLKTQYAIDQRSVAMRQLQTLIDKPGIDQETKEALVWIVEYALDQRRHEDAMDQQRKFRRDLIINLTIAIVFFILGKL